MTMATKIRGRPRTGPTVLSNGFTPKQWEWLRNEALGRHVPIVYILREAVDDYISMRESERCEEVQ